MVGCQLLVLVANRSLSKRAGDPVEVRSYRELEIHPWARLERPPLFVVIDLPDSDPADIGYLLAPHRDAQGKTVHRVRYEVSSTLIQSGVFLPDGLVTVTRASLEAGLRDKTMERV